MNEAASSPLSTLQRLAAIVSHHVGLGSAPALDAETLLADLSMDSIVILELLLAAEAEFEVEIDAQELIQSGDFRSLGSLSKYIDTKLRREG